VATLLLGDVAARGQRRVTLLVGVRLPVLGLGLRELCLGLGYLRLGLPDLTLCVELCLVSPQAALFQLGFEHRNLLLRPADARFGLPQSAAGLLLPGPQLLVVEDGDDLTRLHLITLAHRDLADTSRSFGRDDRVVTLDASAQLDDVGGRRRGAEDIAPDQEPGHRQDG
jgi:hypothetical protein